jgi:hypothetical protein
MADPFVCAIGNVGLVRKKGPPVEARAPVLVVDDEPLVRILTASEAGFFEQVQTPPT